MKMVILIGVLWFASALTPTWAQTVVLDTGHSPKQQGATSAGGRGEFTFNQRLARAVAHNLKVAGIAVRQVEGEVALRDRTQSVGTGDLFVSIHHDSIQQAWIDAGWRERYAGYSVFYSEKNPQHQTSLLCARLVGRAMAQHGQTPSLYHATPIRGENRPLIDPPHSVHRYDDLIVLKSSAAPAILVEAGVIANPIEEARLLREDTVATLSKAISHGIAECLTHWP